MSVNEYNILFTNLKTYYDLYYYHLMSSSSVIAMYNLSDIKEFKEIINKSEVSNILKLNKVECRTNNKEYTFVAYNKNLLTSDLTSTYGLFRSVIINNSNIVVGFSPPKSVSFTDFTTKYNENDPDIVAEEFVEGTMINVFWDETDWEISTRNTIGATSSFYKGPNTKTFRDMFMEASKENNLLLDNLDKKYCYSFVLQHPENRIVVPFKTPQLYLVAMYSINNDVNVEVYEPEEYKNIFVNTAIKFPEPYQFNKYSDLIEKYGSMNTSYHVVGVVIRNKKTGERSKIRNPVYEQVRALKGNQPKLQYQYLSLRKEGKVCEFLTYYPENKKDFSNYRDDLHCFTKTLYLNYVSCYIKKEKKLEEFLPQFKTHMYNIHQKYINDLREKKLFVTHSFVISFVNELHPSLLMYSMNFHMRKRCVDTIVAETNI